ncbi:MAG: hypothetical protein LBK77_04020 [Spirochaetaceae bacterium]|jgi:hypothetical protein|nr:hypothetical protein [Spirochaetaceae bacterium]
MSIFNHAVKTAAAVVILALCSCVLNDPENYGTLSINLPGSSGALGGRAAVSGAYTATLSYRIECNGSGRVTREALPGDSVSIPLSPGDWAVTVTVLNAAGQNIGSGVVPATIEGGKTTIVGIPVSIDTTGTDITRFALTSPVSAQGLIVSDSSGNGITFSVPFGTDISGMAWTATHTGRSIVPAPGTPLDFTSSLSEIFTVTAEKPSWNPKSYIVTVNLTAPDIPGTATWPVDADTSSTNYDPPSWYSYGLAGVTKHASITGPTTAGVLPGDVLVIYVENANDTAVSDLLAQIGSKIGVAFGVPPPVMGYTHYEHTYSISSPAPGGTFTISITHHASGALYLTVKKL